MNGEQLKIEGINRVEKNNQAWIEKMRERAIELNSISGSVSTDELRFWADAINSHPEHPNAWGSIFAGKKWKPIGYKKSRYKSNHARRITIWRYIG